MQTRRLHEGLRITPALRANPEFQSALVRITVCLFGALYIGVGAWTDYYGVDTRYYLMIFVPYLLATIILLISVLRRPDWSARRYLALCLDIIVVSLAISITQQAISPFYLLYILIFISAGTRFGRDHLIVASVVAVIAYNIVLFELDEWNRHPFEAGFFLLLLVLLPLYQASLLRQVQRAREEAVRANQAKGDFLAFMTHELRTPLTGVIGMAELLKDTRLDLEQRDYVQAITSSANALNALIGDILDFSKIDARKLKLEQAPFDPRTLVREVCEILDGRALVSGLELICEVAPEMPETVCGDSLRVRQILFNLVGNAIKFTERGQVRVRAGVQMADLALPRPHLLLEVLDTGIGIPQDKLPLLFESFRQADDSTTRRFGGTGLGTTIARDLAELMGGTIEVESEEGQGSCFRVRLPLLGEDFVLPTLEPGDRLRGVKILVLERNATQRALLCAILEREQALCQGSAELAAVDLSGMNAPDLVVLADSPSGADLPAALAEVRRLCGAQTCCLLLTHTGRRLPQPPSGVLCLNKPFLAEALIDAIATLRAPAPSEKADQADDDAGPAPGPDWQRPHAGPEVRVLVAEDNRIAARVLTTFLGKMGFSCSLFQDGEAALAAALEGGYQIAIIDLRMPKLDGLGFARRYRAESDGRPLPIIALTANAEEEVRRTCFEAGMDGFLAKPVAPAELRRTLERFVSLD